MNGIESASTRFDIKILENGEVELTKLLSHIAEQQKKVQECLGSIHLADPGLSQESNKKIFGIFSASLMELLKINTVVSDFQKGMATKHKIVVAYDVSNQLPQAMGLVLLNREDFKGKKGIELYSLITSIWNLNYPQNSNHPHRVKGAGSSIVEFCKKLGAEHQAEYLYLMGAPGALSFYERLGFKRDPEFAENGSKEDLFAIKRTPMFCDLESK